MKILILLIGLNLFYSCKKKESYEKIDIVKEPITKTDLITSKIIYKQNSVDNDTITAKQNEQINKKEPNSCSCFNGIGSTLESKPILTLNDTLSICGYLNEDIKTDNGYIISEFNVFNCKTGHSYVEYGAVQTCKVTSDTDKINIKELYYLPAGENWTLKRIPISEQTISILDGKITVSDIKPINFKSEISEKGRLVFLNSINRNEGINDNWELEIGKLVVLSLDGDDKAWSILKDYEKYKGEKTDGALAETWKDATALIEWHNNK